MAKLTVLGIGNILMRDEGVGVHILTDLQKRRWPEDVEFIDGGVGGLSLLTVIERAERLLVIDAAQMNLQPGEFRVIAPGQIVQESAQGRLSLHELPFIETLRLCEQFSRAPREVTILAIQPAVIESGLALSDDLSAARPALIQAACELIDSILGP